MPKYKINIQIADGLTFPFQQGWLRNVITAALNAEKIDKATMVDCVITDNATVRRLNKMYRGIDRTTDVLSFAFSDQLPEDSTAFPEVPGAGLSLGEIIISYPQAARQAPVHSNTIERELILLLVHGTLHLLGYDHKKAADASKMRAREEAIIQHIEEKAAK